MAHPMAILLEVGSLVIQKHPKTMSTVTTHEIVQQEMFFQKDMGQEICWILRFFW